MDYINTSHPAFIGGSKAVEVAWQQQKSKSTIPMVKTKVSKWIEVDCYDIVHLVYSYSSCHNLSSPIRMVPTPREYQQLINLKNHGLYLQGPLPPVLLLILYAQTSLSSMKRPLNIFRTLNFATA